MPSKKKATKKVAKQTTVDKQTITEIKTDKEIFIDLKGVSVIYLHSWLDQFVDNLALEGSLVIQRKMTSNL